MRFSAYSTFVFTLIFSGGIFAQCSLAVDAGPDAIVCPGGGQTQLDASILGTNITSITWTPASGLTDPGILNPVATVTGEATYTLTVDAFDPSLNLIANGDFSAGDSGFTTDYDPGSGGFFGLLSDEGQYAITTNSSLTHDGFAFCQDRSGGGNMMVVNGSATEDDNIWCQRVTVTPNTLYSFNAWLMSVIPQNPAQLQFSVNGEFLGAGFRATSTVCSWREFSETWTSGTATTAKICITNQNTDPSGNDFAIDDLFFGPVCVQTDEVTIREKAIEAQAISPVQLPCTAPTTVQLDAMGSSGGALYFYEWATANGRIVSGANTLFPTVDRAGTYVLTTLFDNGLQQCSGQAFVLVSPPPAPPEIVLQQPLPFTCARATQNLSATGTTTGTDLTYRWTATDGGTVLEGADGLRPLILGTGNFTLLVTDTISGCSVSDTVTVVSETAPPAITVAPPAALNCAVDTVELNADVSGSTENFTFGWSTANGNIVAGADGPLARATSAGEYTLRLTDGVTGCSNTATVTVGQDTVRPVAMIQPPAVLTCRDSSQVLDGSQSDDGPEFGWTWSTFDGSFVGDVIDLKPTIDAAGTYELTVRNLTNFCTTTTAVTVSANQQIPPIEAGPAERNLTCLDTVFVLGAAAGAVDGLSYAWSEVAVGSVGTSPTLEVSRPGTFQLAVTDEENGCKALAEVVVNQDTISPGVRIAPVADLTCADPERTISATPASPELAYTANWTTADGNITSPATGFDIDVDRGGIYRLMVRNEANGCTTSRSLAVAEDQDPPNANLASPEFLTCRTTSVQIDASLSSSGDDFSYLWTTDDGLIENGATTRTPTVTEPGIYVLSVRNSRNGCSAEARTEVSEDVELPVLSALPPAELNCVVTETDILASSFNSGGSARVVWSTANGNIVSGGTALSPTVDAPGTYLLTVLNEDTQCMSTLEVVVTEDLTDPIVDLGDDFDLGCDVTPVRLDARTEGRGPFTYRWSSTDGLIQQEATTSQPLIRGSGTYAVVVTSQGNGCVTTADITLTQNLLLGFSADRTVPDCTVPYGSIEFTDVDGGTEPILYSIDGGATFSTQIRADSLAPARYDLVIQDANGCELTDMISIPPPPDLNLFVDPTTVISLGDAHFINTRTNFADSTLTQISWTPALDLDCTDCLRPTATPDRTTTYVIEAMSADGCEATDSVRVIVDVLREVYFPTGFSPNGDGTNDRYLPFANLTRVAQIQAFTIFDRWGATVFTGSNFLPNNPAFGWDGKLNGRPLNPGAFVYSATVEFVDGRVEVFKGEFVLVK